jgi:filamentous hemagglutinin
MLSKEGRTVTSTTLPPKNASYVKKAGTHIDRTIVDPVTREPIVDPITLKPTVQRVVYDQRGFPIFDPYVKYETRITGDLKNMLPDAHKRAATRQLRADIESGRVDRRIFSDTEFYNIQKGKAKIGDYTWHHHQDTGRIQLVPEDVNDWFKHIGGNSIWRK